MQLLSGTRNALQATREHLERVDRELRGGWHAPAVLYSCASRWRAGTIRERRTTTEWNLCKWCPQTRTYRLHRRSPSGRQGVPRAIALRPTKAQEALDLESRASSIDHVPVRSSIHAGAILRPTPSLRRMKRGARCQMETPVHRSWISDRESDGPAMRQWAASGNSGAGSRMRSPYKAGQWLFKFPQARTRASTGRRRSHRTSLLNWRSPTLRCALACFEGQEGFHLPDRF